MIELFIINLEYSYSPAIFVSISVLSSVIVCSSSVSLSSEHEMKKTSNEIVKKASEKMHTLQRIGKPKDISNMIKFLINPDNNWITGQNFIVDGGLSSTK